MSVRGNTKRKLMIPVIGLKRNAVGSKQKDIVPVRGHSRTEQMIPVIGSKLTSGTTIHVVGSKEKD